MNNTLNIDNPFISTGAIDTMTQNSGKTAMERINDELPEPANMVDADQHAHHGPIDYNEARILADFSWAVSSAGKRYLKAKPAYIDRLKQAGPAVIEQFVVNLREGDAPAEYTRTYDDAMALGLLQQTSSDAVAAIDKQVCDRELADMFNAAAWKALTAFSMLTRAEGWAQSLGDRDPPEKLTQLIVQAESAGLDAAFWYTRAYTASGGRDLTNWTTAAWDFAGYQGNNNTKFLGDPTRHGTNNSNANNASLTLVSRLIPRRAKAA